MKTNDRDRFILFSTSAYAVLALAWIFLSDQLLSVFADIESIVWLSTAKGIVFVAVTATLFFFALRAVPAAKHSGSASLLETFASGLAPGNRPRWLTYAFAIAITLAMLMLRSSFSVTFGGRPMLILFMFPIILSALLGGFGPGLLSTALAALGVDYLVIPPVHSLSIESGHDLFQWSFLIVNGLAVSLLSEALRRSLASREADRRLLGAVVAGTSDAVFVKDAQGRYLLVNAAASRFVGKTAEEIIGHDDFFLFPESSARALIETDRAIMSAGRTQTHEEHISTLDGLAIEFLVTKGPVLDDAGKVVGLFGISRDVTARNLAEAALQNSETALKEAQSLASVGSWTWDLQTGIHQWSDEIYLIYGRDRKLPAAGYPEVAQYFTPESWANLAAAVEKGLAEGNSYQCDAEVVRPDGSHRWITARGKALRDAESRITHLHGTVQDITERKEADSQRYLFSEATRQSSQPLLLTDAQTLINYVNPAFSRLFGYQLDELAGKPVSCLVPPTDSEQLVHAEAARQLRAGDTWSAEVERLSRDGQRIPVIANVGSITDDKGNLIGFVASYHDLRPLREKDFMLRKLSLAVEQSPESIIITNLAAEIEYVNEAFVEKTGYGRDEVIGQKPNILRSGRTPAAVYGELWNALKNGQPWRGELSNRSKDGSEYIDLSIITPIRQIDGSISHYVAVQQDITEFKRNAEELCQHRQHLEELVEERTREVRQQTQSLRAMIDNIPHMAWLKDADGHFIA
ncbi:MAG TPA: PAS domain S-box protein, partial [Azonexus sp.]|nr:PAS domain S-box protein [Azonexus sp.]